MATSSGDVPMPHVIQSPPVDISKPLNYPALQSKTILITGGASGLGAAMFECWASHGATVIIGDINDSAGIALVAATRTSTNNPNLHFIHLDVIDWKSQTSFFKQACQLSLHGGIDTLVTCAGIGSLPEAEAFENPPDYPSMADPPAPSFKTLDINLTGTMYSTTLATSYLSRNPGSQKCTLSPSPDQVRDRHIVLISSIAGLAPLASQSIYTASKHGVVGLFRALRTTHPVTHGIRINMLNPYYVDTPILGPLGSIVLAGTAPASIDSVVEAATRLVTDPTIIGRGLAVVNRASADDIKSVGLQGRAGQAIWDVHAHDFEQSDVVTKRMVALTNLSASARGRIGLLADLLAALSKGVWAFLGLK